MSKTEDFFDKAADQADEATKLEERKAKAEWWNFEGKGGEDAQPEFKGKFLEAALIEKQGDNGSYPCVLAFLEDMDGTMFKAWFSAGSAVRAFNDTEPAAGALVYLRYEGKRKTDRGNEQKVYSLVADTQDPELWGAYRKKRDSRSVRVGAAQGTSAPAISPDEAPF